MRIFLAAFLAAVPLAAQSLVTARAGLIYMVEGPVTVNGQLVRIQNKVTPPQMNPGQVLISPRGHAELLMGQDAVLWTGIDAQLRLDDANVDAPRVSLLAGSAMLEIKHTREERRIFIDLGNQTAEIADAGIYRFDRSPERIRVWSGSAVLQGPPGTLSAGEAAQEGRRERFDRNEMDELVYFAASRSLILEADAGRLQRWKRRGNNNYKHAGFDLEFPLPASAARAMYLAASEAGLVYYLEAGITANGRPPAVPFRAGRTVLTTNNGRAEVFLGLGIVGRMNDHTRLRIVDTKNTAPSVVLESGDLMIEVGKAAKYTYLSVRLGDSVTQLHKPGVYRFQKMYSSLVVYGGEGVTHLGSATVRSTRGQRLDLSASQATPRLDRPNRDAFFQWNVGRSLQLFGAAASFMVDWEPQVEPSRIKHKVFGEQFDSRRFSRPQLMQPRTLPPRGSLPPIDQSPSGKGP